MDADQCQYGARVATGIDAGSPVKKATGFLSNSEIILKELSRRCRGRNGSCSRRLGGTHALCSGRVASEAARYPVQLCKAIVRGITRQLDAIGIHEPGMVGMHAVTDEKKDLENLKRADNGYSGRYKDDLTGQPLRDDLVRAARALELEYFNSKGVWRKRPRQEAYSRTGRAPISVRWVDVNKGDDMNPRYRSRLVARQLKATDKSGASFFAPTPPLEALRTVLSLAATSIDGWRPCYDPASEKRTQVGFLDISSSVCSGRVRSERPGIWRIWTAWPARPAVSSRAAT